MPIGVATLFYEDTQRMMIGYMRGRKQKNSWRDIDKLVRFSWA